MTKKMVKFVTLGVICLSMLFTGCGYKFTPLTGGPSASEAIVGANNGAVVQKGKYLFAVNGIYDSADTNDYSEEVKRGEIYRVELDADGNVVADSAKLLCGKQVYSATETSGLYLEGDRLYFTSPSVHRDKRGELLTSYLDIYSVKLDGTGLKELGYITNNTYTHKWYTVGGKVYFVYIDSTEKKIMSLDEDGKTRVLVEDYADAQAALLGDDNYVYYERKILKDGSSEEDREEDREYESYYTVHRTSIADGKEERLIGKDSPIVKNPYVTNGSYALTLSKAEGNVLYYKKPVVSGNDAVTSLYAFGLAENQRKEVCISTNDLTTVHKYLGFADDGSYRGVIATYSGKIFVVSGTDGLDQQQLMMRVSTLPTAILAFDGEYMYYVSGSKIVRYRYTDGTDFLAYSEEEDVYEAAVNSSTFMPKIIGDYLYSSPTTTSHPAYANYLYRVPKVYVKPENKDDKIQPVLIGKLTEDDQKAYKKEQDKLDKEKEDSETES